MTWQAPQSFNIGVFDSGFGGLTVLRELLRAIPEAHFLYVGDTARLPYGAKSPATVARYATESARFLEDRGAEMLVIACNTASALALAEIRAAVRVPVIGVIQPGATAAANAVASSRSNDCRRDEGDESQGEQVLVLATAATVQSHAYRSACAEVGLRATEKACPLLVPLVEEGWTEHHITNEVLRIYLQEALAECTPAAVVLGCTHYPLLAKQIERTLRSLGSHAHVVDSAHATAATVARSLASRRTLPPQAHSATFECFATDSVEKFQRLGSLFLDQPIPEVHLLDLGG
jgi:glutamate racemase